MRRINGLGDYFRSSRGARGVESTAGLGGTAIAKVSDPASARDGLRRIIALAAPVAMADLGWVCMGIEDSMFVGRLGATALGAVCLGNIVNAVLGLCGAGLLLGLDTFVSRSFGASRRDECREWLYQGLFLVAVFGPVLTATMYFSVPLFGWFGVKPEVIKAARPFVHALSWSLLPLYVFAAFRRYMQAVGAAHVVMFALVSANIVNIAGDWLLLKQFGIPGIGWSTCSARLYMAAVLVGSAVYRDRHLLTRWVLPHFGRLRSLVRLGVPAATQLLVEVGMFATASLLAGRLEPASLAAHQIAMNIAGFTFMIPLGISSAGAVVVGQALGSRNPRRAKRDGWTAVLLGAGVMAIASAALVSAPYRIARAFTSDARVLSIAPRLLLIAALFQIFDGLQVVATGVLRGAGNTRVPMLANIGGHWLLGLPIGFLLCFSLGLGVRGLWMGLSIGLIAVACTLVFVWWRTAPQIDDAA